MGLLDKENPAEDFYERKHLNSDLICCNFTELTDNEFYETLTWANTTLMKNYYDKQRNSTLAQIKYLYKERDVTFRGFRHSEGQLGGTGDKSKKFKVVPINKNKTTNKEKLEQQRDTENRGAQVVDGMTNWENSSSDGERFSQKTSNDRTTKTLDSFEIYSKKKEARAEAKKIAKTSIKALR